MTVKEIIEESKKSISAWIVDHKEDIVKGTYTVLVIAGIAIPLLSKAQKTKKDFNRSRMIYDPSMGFYWETKRSLSSNQKLMIEERHRNGESYGKILKDMNLLKK